MVAGTFSGHSVGAVRRRLKQWNTAIQMIATAEVMKQGDGPPTIEEKSRHLVLKPRQFSMQSHLGRVKNMAAATPMDTPASLANASDSKHLILRFIH